MLPNPARAADDISPVMRKLSAYMAQAPERALPDNAAREAKYHILDTLAAMISGSDRRFSAVSVACEIPSSVSRAEMASAADRSGTATSTGPSAGQSGTGTHPRLRN